MDTILVGGDKMFKLGKVEEKVLLIVIVVLFVVLAVLKFAVLKPESVEVVKKDEPKAEQIESKEAGKIYIYITGEVNKPGMYTLKAEDRIADAVALAGGFTTEADASSINLAQKLEDEEFINIAKISVDGEQNTAIKTAISGGRININTATAKELDEFLPGIGETYANSIVNYRNKNGRFKSIEELTNVEGIGKGKRFERIKSLLTVN